LYWPEYIENNRQTYRKRDRERKKENDGINKETAKACI
jgi:hypothetical protein